jgi:hypothetical protein
MATIRKRTKKTSRSSPLDEFDLDYNSAFDIPRSRTPERRPLKRAKRKKTSRVKIKKSSKKMIRAVSKTDPWKVLHDSERVTQVHRRKNR